MGVRKAKSSNPRSAFKFCCEVEQRNRASGGRARDSVHVCQRSTVPLRKCSGRNREITGARWRSRGQAGGQGRIQSQTGRPSRREIPEPGSRDGLGQEGTRDHGSPHTGPGRTHCSWQYMSQVRARQGMVMQREAGALGFHQSESLREASGSLP